MHEPSDTALGRLASFPDGCHVAVVGAGGGIGSALCDQLCASTRVGRVYGLTRTPEGLPARADGRFVALRSDYDDPQSLQAAAAVIAADGRLHLAIIASGVLHDGAGVQPEKDWRQIEPDAMRRNFEVNTIGPALAAQALLPLMPKSGRSVFAAISARVGSISDNHIGGWYSYRASKAALNMVVRTLAIELARKRRETVCAAIHPGTVDTELSAPFQSATRTGQVVPATQAAGNILSVIDRLDAASSGKLIAWNGEVIAY